MDLHREPRSHGILMSVSKKMSNNAVVSQSSIVLMHSKNKKYFQAPFLVLQLVANMGFASVPGKTYQYLEAP